MYCRVTVEPPEPLSVPAFRPWTLDLGSSTYWLFSCLWNAADNSARLRAAELWAQRPGRRQLLH